MHFSGELKIVISFHFEFGPFKNEIFDFLTTYAYIIIVWIFYFKGS